MGKAQTRAKWLKVYREFQESGQSYKEFSSERGLNYHTVKGWMKVFDKEGAGEFVEVSLPAGSELYAIMLRNGRKLELPPYFTQARVRRLIEVCESC